MAWIVDGSNVLGALGWNRESRAAKERLATLCARFARHERKRTILFFDGAAPSGFARKLGGLSVRFSFPRAADDIIVQLTRDSNEPWTVVTSDHGISGRVRRRTVALVTSQDFAGRLVRLTESRDEGSGEGGSDDDWNEYFSDPQNRIF